MVVVLVTVTAGEVELGLLVLLVVVEIVPEVEAVVTEFPAWVEEIELAVLLVVVPATAVVLEVEEVEAEADVEEVEAEVEEVEVDVDVYVAASWVRLAMQGKILKALKATLVDAAPSTLKARIPPVAPNPKNRPAGPNPMSDRLGSVKVVERRTMGAWSAAYPAAMTFDTGSTKRNSCSELTLGLMVADASASELMVKVEKTRTCSALRYSATKETVLPETMHMAKLS